MKYLEHIKTTYDQITKSDYDGTLWAKVYKINTEGFKATVQGVKGLIPFDNMPWEYERESHWQMVAPYLIGKAYDTQVLGSNEDTLKLSLSVKHHSYTKKNFTLGQSYECIVLEKTKKHLLVETGLNSNFRNGSQYGTVSIFDFWDIENFVRANEGDKITLTYLDELNSGFLTMCEPVKYTSWYKQKPEKLVDTIVAVNVSYEAGVKYYKVYDHFNGELALSPILYDQNILEELQTYVQKLNDGDVIQCLVHGLSSKTNEVILKIHPKLLALLENKKD
ncbi:hypothetical protein N8368_01190 [Bacteroidia bacterium]|nr:hypothetical protein [Bacteroidia bacterium]MDC1395102.1 hypothetical protein [Bacteroidia bacterium]